MSEDPAGTIHLSATVPVHMARKRLDHVVSELFPEYSRSRLQAWIKSGELTVDGETRRPGDKVSGGEDIEVEAVPEEVSFGPEPIELDIVFEDDAILVVDKPVGMVVHPGAGNPGGTLMNGLLHRAPALSALPRAGIVHRLDKETSGLMVVAKTLASQNALVAQLQTRMVSRIYEAVAYGVLSRSGTVEASIARHRENRLKMAVIESGKKAVTHYRPLATFFGHTHLELTLETGRTHQIRVHMQHIGHPLVGDSVYGGGYKVPRNKSENLISALKGMSRQALHARKLALDHPETGKRVEFESVLPSDMASLLDVLREST